MGACNTDSVNTGGNQQVTLPMTLPQTQGSWQAFVQQLQSVLSLAQQGTSRPASSSTPIQYATFFSSTLPAFQTSGCTVSADNTWGLFGGYSLKVAVTAPNAYVIFGASGYPFPLPPNEQWLSSCYVKASTASAQFKMGFQTANGTYQNTVTTSATAGTVTQPAIPLNLVADNASACTFRLDFPSASGTTFNFDGFQNEPSVTGTINPSPFLLTNIIAGSIAANMITVSTLSALTANMGTLTAGVIQSIDGRFTVDCTNELITIKDSTPTIRMQIGQISSGVYDIKIWNAAGTLLFDAANGLQYAGAPVQVTQVINNNAGNGQLNVNPTGGVVSLLPYNNHATPVTTTIASTVDANNSYLQHGTVFDAHIGGVKVDTLTDAIYARPLATALTTGQVDLSRAGVIGKVQTNIADDANYVRQTMQSGNANAVDVPNAMFQLGSGTTVPPGWQINNGTPGIAYIASGQYYGAQYLRLLSPVAENEVLTSVATYKCKPGDVVSVGGMVESFNGQDVIVGVRFLNAAGGVIAQNYNYTTTGAWTAISATGAAPANTVAMCLFIEQIATAANQQAWFNEVWCSINDVRQPNSSKAYVDFTDATSGGHVGKTLANIADAAGRNAVSSVDINSRALIDFSQPGHVSAVVDYLGGVQGGTCYDGQVITFNPTYSTAPIVLFSGGGMSYSSAAGSAVSQSQQFTASSLSTTGFTASLKLVTGGTLTAQTDSFTTVTAGSEYKCTLTNAPAYNSQYTVNFTLSLGSASGGTVYIRETSISGTILWSKAYLTAQNGAKSITVTWSGATGTSVIDLSLVLSEGTGTISATSVTFTSGTAPTTYSAVPSTAPINWFAYPSS